MQIHLTEEEAVEMAAISLRCEIVLEVFLGTTHTREECKAHFLNIKGSCSEVLSFPHTTVLILLLFFNTQLMIFNESLIN